MADDTNSSYTPGRLEGRRSTGRQGGPREPGGFRIRLSDNEMQAARALQEAFGLRSTVAVLGFALRSMAQQLEQGQLTELVQQHQTQAGGARDSGFPRGDNRGHRGGDRETRSQRPPKADPFARPSKPVPPPPAAEPDQELALSVQGAGDTSNANTEVTAAELSTEPSSVPSEATINGST